MGCAQSKIENEEAVIRCKERKQFMKEAVSYRNAFAAAHSSYAMSLKNTGAALSDFAQGEVPASYHTSSSIPTDSSAPPEALRPPPPISSIPPPPPPLDDYNQGREVYHQPLQRAASMPEMVMQKKQEIMKAAVAPTIIEEDEMMELESHENDKLIRKRSSSSNRGSRRTRGEDHNQMEQQQQAPQQHHHHQHQQDSAYDYFFPPVDSIPAPSLEVPVVEEEQEVVRVNKDEEVGRKVFDEKAKRVAEEEEVDVEEKKVEKDQVEVPVPVPASVQVPEKKLVQKGEGGRRVVKGTSLMQIFTELDDRFLKASESAHDVSKMLEATRLHYHSNFADNRGHIDHSARLMRVITWNRSFKGIPKVDEGKDDFDSEEHETHATVLDKMLAWEKKLYDEVKAGELMKIEYQRKVRSLTRQKTRGSNTESLEKLKAAVSHLHTRYIVDMQSMDSTVSEINRLRDEQLYPKLVQLVDGMATMWETMRVQHEAQSKIVTALRALDNSQSLMETSEHHHDRTFQLLVVVQEWHSQFCKLIDNQIAYIKALYNWLNQNLIPIESSLKEKVSSPLKIQSPLILSLLKAWQDFLEKLQHEAARSAINNFAAVIHTIVQHQEEEMKLKEKCEDTLKELSRKKRQFEDWHHKYMQQRTPDELDPEGGEDNSHKNAIAERQFIVYSVEKRLEDEEEEYQKHCLQVREKSLASLKTRLPELFRAMYDIAVACSNMYRNLQSISQHKFEASAHN